MNIYLASKNVLDSPIERLRKQVKLSNNARDIFRAQFILLRLYKIYFNL